MKIDSHQHFWQYEASRDAWITEDMNVIKRDFMPEDLLPDLIENEIDGCVAVQADQSETETLFLLHLANTHRWIKGVVGWVDLLTSDVQGRLEYFKQNSNFKGVRHILQAESVGFMTNNTFVEGVKQVGEQGLTYDILVSESQLVEVHQLVKKLPEMNLVIDHIGKPDIKNQSFEFWKEQMKKISEYDHVHLKLSGMATEANWQSWSADQFQPYIDICLEYFSPDRLMFGSDWPVCQLAGRYKEIYESLKTCISELSTWEQLQIQGKTAIKFYELDLI